MPVVMTMNMGAEGTDPEMEDSDFDQLQANLQKMVIEDARQSYSEIVVEHAMNPRNAGVMEDADGYGSSFGNCGDSIEMWLKVKDKQISRISFWTDGCGATSAAASITTEMAQNRSLAQAQQISTGDILQALGGLPPDHEHCATLAVNALKDAIKNYLAFEREPWKRAYGKL